MTQRHTGPVRTIALIGRKPGMSFAAFDEYWRHKHAPLAAKVPGVTRYVQRHVVPQGEATEPDNGFGIDGLAELDYESAEAMDAGWASEAGQAALADVDNFIGKHYVVVLERPRRRRPGLTTRLHRMPTGRIPSWMWASSTSSPTRAPTRSNSPRPPKDTASSRSSCPSTRTSRPPAAAPTRSPTGGRNCPASTCAPTTRS